MSTPPQQKNVSLPAEAPVSLPNPPVILGLNRTKLNHAKKYINSNQVTERAKVSTLRDLFLYQFQLKNSLEKSGLFKQVTVSSNSDTSKSSNLERAADLNNNDVAIVINVVEKNLVQGSIDAETKVNKPNAIHPSVKLSLNNFGRGESINLETEKDPLLGLNAGGVYSSFLPETYKMSFHKPILTERGVHF